MATAATEERPFLLASGTEPDCCKLGQRGNF
jgi:hypothetical protein